MWMGAAVAGELGYAPWFPVSETTDVAKRAEFARLRRLGHDRRAPWRRRAAAWLVLYDGSWQGVGTGDGRAT